MSEKSTSHKLDDAINLAHQYHAGQKRLDGSDFIQHPLNVVEVLKESGFNEEELFIAAILHDVCEDTSFCNLNLSKTFGERVGYIVNALSKNKKSKNGKSIKTEDKEDLSNRGKFNYRFWMYINRLADGIMEDPYILFIKMADQVDNLSTMGSFSPQKQRRKLDEIEECFLPIYKKFEPSLPGDYFESYQKLKLRLTSIMEEKKKELILKEKAV